jgi:hypothetical protein
MMTWLGLIWGFSCLSFVNCRDGRELVEIDDVCRMLCNANVGLEHRMITSVLAGYSVPHHPNTTTIARVLGFSHLPIPFNPTSLDAT